MTLSAQAVLLRPVISEKSVMETERNNYTFAVARDANKFQIKAAVEEQFKVDVLGVRVLTVSPSRSAAAADSWAPCPAGARRW